MAGVLAFVWDLGILEFIVSIEFVSVNQLFIPSIFGFKITWSWRY